MYMALAPQPLVMPPEEALPVLPSRLSTFPMSTASRWKRGATSLVHQGPGGQSGVPHQPPFNLVWQDGAAVLLTFNSADAFTH